ELYGVEVRHLNQQVKRNSKRFPGEFLFQLSSKDVKSLRSQFVISNNGRGGRRYMPYAFTEYGAIMAATILNSERASNEHFRGEGLRANAAGSDHESADRRQT